MEEGKNIFLLDGPIGRKRFFINILILIAYCILFTIVCCFIAGFAGINIYTKPLITTLLIFMFILIYYINIINYSKRLQDVIGVSKWKSLLYVVLFFIAIAAMNFIPIIKYIAPVIGFMFFIFMGTIKGHLFNDDSDTEQIIEAQVVESENQE